MSPSASRLQELLAGPDVTISSQSLGSLEIEGVSASIVGEVAARAGIVLHELVDLAPSLEEAFMELTEESVQYRGSADASTLHTDPNREAA